jgi:hypothetical protein
MIRKRDKPCNPFRGVAYSRTVDMSAETMDRVHIAAWFGEQVSWLVQLVDLVNGKLSFIHVRSEIMVESNVQVLRA